LKAVNGISFWFQHLQKVLRMDWATQTDDLAQHAAQSRDDIVHVIQQRYAVQRNTSWIGGRSLLVLQGKLSTPSNDYEKLVEEEALGEFESPPDVLLLTSHAFHQMLQKQENQSIMIWYSMD
jgi:hypothetical protein